MPFADNFEDGTLNAWTTAEAQWSVQGAVKYEGAFAALGAGGVANRLLQKDLGSDYVTDGLLSLYFRTNNVAGEHYIVYTPANAIIEVGGHFCYFDGAYQNFPNDKLCVVNTWYKIAVRFCGANKYRVWINDEYAGEVNALVFAAITSLRSYSCGVAGRDMYLDRVRIGILKDALWDFATYG